MRVGGTTEYYARVDAFLSRCITLGEGFQLLDRAAHGVVNRSECVGGMGSHLARVFEHVAVLAKLSRRSTEPLSLTRYWPDYGKSLGIKTT